MAEFKGIPEDLSVSLQENVIALVSSSDEHCRLVTTNVPLELYSNRVMRDLATQVYGYVHTYGKAPKDHLPDIVEDKLDGPTGEVMRQILENIHAILQGGFNVQFVVNQLHHFVRQQHLKKAVTAIIEAAEKGDIDHADNAIDAYRGTSFAQFSPGLTLRDHVSKLGSEESRTCFQTGIAQLDQSDLGPARGELHLFLAPPKRGKTWWLTHVTKHALLSRLRVVYVTLEVSPAIIAGRLLQSMFALTRREGEAATSGVLDFNKHGDLQTIRVEEVAKRIALSSVSGMTRVKKAFADRDLVARMSDNLRIQSFPTGQLRIKELEAYLENLVAIDRFMPDVVVVDMASLMAIDVRNYRLSLGVIFKDLRGIAVERNLALVTASQSNRASIGARFIDERHAAEDISQIGIADCAFTYNQTPVEREFQVARLFIAVARNSRDKWTLNISQAYPIGQFCTGSAVVPADTWTSKLPKRSALRDETEDDSDEQLHL